MSLHPDQEQAIRSNHFKVEWINQNIYIQHVLSGLRLRAFPVEESHALPSATYWNVLAKSYSIPSIVAPEDYINHPVIAPEDITTDGSYAYDRDHGLGIGTSLYTKLNEKLPATARISGATSSQEAVHRIRTKMHQMHPFRWEQSSCSWCITHIYGGIYHRENGVKSRVVV